jgi:hypothetical protein
MRQSCAAARNPAAAKQAGFPSARVGADCRRACERRALADADSTRDMIGCSWRLQLPRVAASLIPHPRNREFHTRETRPSGWVESRRAVIGPDASYRAELLWVPDNKARQRCLARQYSGHASLPADCKCRWHTEMARPLSPRSSPFDPPCLARQRLSHNTTRAQPYSNASSKECTGVASSPAPGRLKN